MFDVLVIGAGPSGLATAIEAALRGLSCAVVDARPGTIDKACGEGLMPGAWRRLEALGVHVPRERPFTGISYHWGEDHAEGRFVEPGHGVRRTILHAALEARARQLGIQRIHARVDEIQQDDDGVAAVGIRARWLVAADGLRSPIRHQLGLATPTRWPDRFGLRQHFEIEPWSDRVEVHWTDHAEAYITPVADDRVGVAFLFGETARLQHKGKPGRPFDRLLHRFPVLQERLAGAAIASKARGAGPFAQGVSRRVAGRVLLVGDAAGYLDPLTGEGIKLGLYGAQAVVDAIVANEPERWERRWRQLYRPYARSTGGLLVFTRPRWTRRMLVPVLRRSPWLFDRILRTLAA